MMARRSLRGSKLKRVFEHRAIDILKGFLNPPEDGIVNVSDTYVIWRPNSGKTIARGRLDLHDISKTQYPGPKYIGHDKAGVKVLNEIPDSEFDNMLWSENKKYMVETFVHYHMRKEVKDRKKINHIVEAVKEGLTVKSSL